MEMTHYEVLGIQRKARLADVKRAYKRLARRHHPDLNPGDRRAEDHFRQISEAYAVLSDPQKRKAYDREIDAPHAAFSGRQAPSPAGWDGDWRSRLPITALS